MRPYKLAVYILFLIIALPSLASAVGCCFVNELDFIANQVSGVSECIDDGRTDENTGLRVSEQTCVNNLRGTWSPYACSQNQANCAPICCCLQGSEYDTVSFACYDQKVAKTEGSTCAQLCDNYDATLHTITITVNNPDNTPAEGIRVTVIGTANTYTQLTGPDGNAVFERLEQGTYTISARNPTNNLCYGYLSPRLLRDQDLTLVLVLTCTQAPPEIECTPFWECSFTDPVKIERNCGQYDECVDANECDPPQTYPGTLPWKPCPQGECGNGDVDADEECDTNDQSFNEICSDYQDANGVPFDIGEVTCTNCRIDTSSCYTCPDYPTSCTLQQCQECPSCAARRNLCPIDEEECQGEITISDITPLPRTALIWFTWNYPCKDLVRGYTVNRWQGDVIEQRYSFDYTDNNFKLSDDVRFDEEQSLEPNTEYCYTVELIVEQQGQLEIITNEEEACITTGDEYCMAEHPDRFCADRTMLAEDAPPPIPPEGISWAEGHTWRAVCDQTNHIVIESGNDPPYYCGEQACFGPDLNGETSCENSAVCVFCSGVFGMYAHLARNNDVRIMLSTEPNPIACSGLLRGGADALCYDRSAITAADDIGKCSDVRNCYSYTTKEACEDNPCGLASLEGACAWNPLLDNQGRSLSDQAGLGVCVPTDPAHVLCEQCSFTTHVFPSCNDALCELHSTANPSDCYFTDNELCLPKTNMGCDDYENEAECTGGRDFSIDITYDGREAVAGTHTRTPSNDENGFDVCQWVSVVDDGARTDKCIKNSDGYSISPAYNSDCEGREQGFDQEKCKMDSEPPVTTLRLPTQADQPGLWAGAPVFSRESFTFSYDVKDERYAQSELELLFLMDPADEAVKNALGIGNYPYLTYEELTHYPWLTGDYQLSYFSSDPARNLEIIRTASLVIDVNGPEISNVRIIKVENEVNDDLWLTDVTVTYQVADAHGPITCTNKFKERNVLEGGSVDRIITLESGSTATLRYPYLVDADYDLTIECKDAPPLNNPTTRYYTVSVDADRSIHTPLPQDNIFPTDDDPIQFSVQTANAGECYYSDDSNQPYTDRANPDVHPFTASADGLTHTAMVIVSGTGKHHYHVGCFFPDINRLTEGKSSDMIVFAIDDQAPMPRITLIDDSPYQPEEYADQVTIKFHCEDSHPLLNSTDADVWDANYGVEEVYYCVTNNQQDACDDYASIDVGDVETFLAGETIGQYLHYYCEDKGGHRSEARRQFLMIKDTNFAQPEVMICDRRGECIQAS